MLTPRQRRIIEQLVHDHHQAFLVSVCGSDAVSQEEYQRLIKSGLVGKNPLPTDPATAAHMIGLLTGDVDEETAKALESEVLWQMHDHLELALTPIEREALTVARTRIGEHIKDLGRKLSSKTGQVLVEADDKLRRQRLAQVRKQIASGIAERLPVEEIANKLRKLTKDNARDWLRVVRTEMHNALSEGKAAALLQAEPGTDPLVFKRTQADACFVSGTLVTTARGQVPIEMVKVGDLVMTHKLRWRPVVRTFVRPYSGRLVSCTAGSHRVKMTATHPVLANMDWIDAEALQHGDDVVGLRVIRDSNDDPAAFSQQAFLGGVSSSGLSGVVPVAVAVKLYRDLMLRDSDVDVEFSDCVLRYGLIASQVAVHAGGFWRHHRACALARSGHSTTGARSSRFLDGSASVLGQALAFGFAHALETALHPVRRALEWGVCVSQALDDDLVGDSVGLGDTTDRGVRIGRVLVDDVCDGQSKGDFSAWHGSSFLVSQQSVDSVVVSSYTGPVYNLGVDENESYFAGGLAVHNCAYCKLLYLKPDGITPRIFRLSQLQANGTNVGRAARRPTRIGKMKTEWRAVVGAIHPSCACELYRLPDGMAFGAGGKLVRSVKKSVLEIEALDRAYAHDHDE
jgi:hypothetical protein